MGRFEDRAKICAVCPVPKSTEQQLCAGQNPRRRAAFSDCPHGLFFLSEAQRTAQLEALSIDHPPFSREPAPPPENDAQIEALLNDPSKRLPRGWEKQPDVVRVYRDALRAAAQRIPAYPGGTGRGIVIVAGGKYWSTAIVTLKICRHVGIDLPVEMWSLPGELTEGQRQYTQALGVTIREAPARGGWELKARALVGSRFAEVLYLDADSYPVQNVEDFWNCDGFKSTGWVMFPDRPSPLRPLGIEPGDRLKQHVFDAFGLPFMNQRSIEAGQMFIDRARAWRTLWLADWVCDHSNYFFKILYGDKDTWWLCARLLNEPYYVMPTFWDHEGGLALVHFDWNDKIRFIHRVHGKFDLYDAGFTTTRQAQERRDQLPHESKVWEIFEQLKIDMADDVAAHAAALRAARQREIVIKPDRPPPPSSAAKPCKTCGAAAPKPWDGSKHWKRLHEWTATADLSTAAQWLQGFVASIECDHCRAHAADYLKKVPPDVSSNLALCIWAWTFHNHVNRELKKPVMCWNDADQIYRWSQISNFKSEIPLAPLTPDQVRSSDGH